MKKQLIILSCLAYSIFFITSCDENVISPPYDQTGLGILGTWDFNGAKISFAPNGNYKSIDLFTVYNNTTSSYDTIFAIFTAKFRVEDKIIYYSDFTYSYEGMTTAQLNFSGESYSSYIEHSGDSLVLRPLHVYEKIEGSPGTLKGKWSNTRSGFIYSSTSLPHLRTATIKIEYTFVPEEMRYGKATSNPLYIPSFYTEYGDYEYQDNKIKLELGGWTPIEVIGYKLFWFNGWRIVFQRSN
jgi:hypothetical protein